MSKVTNVKFAGLGGQGILTCTDILGRVVFDLGNDVKKAEVHGMSQRGGSITSDLRFGDKVLSPMILLVKPITWLFWAKIKLSRTSIS